MPLQSLDDRKHLLKTLAGRKSWSSDGRADWRTPDPAAIGLDEPARRERNDRAPTANDEVMETKSIGRVIAEESEIVEQRGVDR